MRYMDSLRCGDKGSWVAIVWDLLDAKGMDSRGFVIYWFLRKFEHCERHFF